MLKRRGFTLVELLVVIGIIAVLVSLLLPAISKARAAGLRVACISNMRQVYMSAKNYATDNRDQVPLGYVNGYKTFNYLLYYAQGKGNDNTQPTWGPGGTLTGLGLAWQAGYFKDPLVLYCSVSYMDQTKMYNGSANPWPPGSGGLSYHTSTSYGARPMLAANFGRQPFPIVLDPLTNTYKQGPFPKMSKYKSKAILSDLTSGVGNGLLSAVTMRHGDGANVFFGDSSSQWVPLKAFKNNMNLITASDFGTTVGSNAMLTDDETSGIWADFDRYHQTN